MNFCHARTPDSRLQKQYNSPTIRITMPTPISAVGESLEVKTEMFLVQSNVPFSGELQAIFSILPRQWHEDRFLEAGHL